MAAEAQTENFNFSDATVMVGPMASVMDLTPSAHSIGLIRNLQVTANLTKVNLPQGIQNVTAHSTVTGAETTANFEVYEYTSKNLAHALGIAVTTFAEYENHTLNTDVTGDGLTTDTIIIDAATDISADYPVGSWVMLRADTVGRSDLVFLATVVSRTYDAGYDTLTIELNRALPVGFNFKVGDTVSRQNQLPVGRKESQVYVGMKIAAKLPEGKSITLVFPKVQIRGGFNLAFITDNYSNMPFVFECFDQVPTDPMYSDLAFAGFLQVYTNT